MASLPTSPKPSPTPTIAWGAYCVVYYVQAVIMSMILMNVPVFLRRGLGLDWLGVTAAFVVMFAPVLLRPAFAWWADRHSTSLNWFLYIGAALVIAGSAGASVGAIIGMSGVALITAGLAVAVVGATLLNVAADSHIIRAVLLERSARVNGVKKFAAFLGIANGQLCYIFWVGADITNLTAWAKYFAIPAIAATVGYVAMVGFSRGRQFLSPVTGLPPVRAPWLFKIMKDGESARPAPILVGLVLVATFLFSVPDGFVEAPFEVFLVDTYGETAWVTYSSVILVGGIIGAGGYLLAGWRCRHAPEWDLAWFLCVAAAYNAFLWSIPSFPGVLWVTVVAQLPATFVQVRLLQSWQGHAYSRRPSLLFQVFVVTYQLGKVVGIGASGVIMTAVGYAGVFATGVLISGITLGLIVVYLILFKRLQGSKKT
ncbi:MAG: hypothetical protein RBG13Loki_0525 [Promethearchaeota archaeon CR_4]|nr:MAG: hypothetical protein RBG13Loki_0525 [Candidatus Lokiarchaeota archaeon CR_4]